MPEEKYPIPHTEPVSLEKSSKPESQEVAGLKERVEKLEAQLRKEQAPEDKERMVKQEIKSYLEELQQVPSSAAPVATRDETDEIIKFEPDQQIGALVSLAFDKNLQEAISVARELNNPAILDEFHDILVDRYYNMLVEKKILKVF